MIYNHIVNISTVYNVLISFYNKKEHAHFVELIYRNNFNQKLIKYFKLRYNQYSQQNIKKDIMNLKIWDS